MTKILDCIIIGGGIAGLQAAIQLGRYNHDVLIIDAEDGRSTICKSYHNILGYPNGISGSELRSLGRKQAESLGVEFLKSTVTSLKKEEGHLRQQLKRVCFNLGKFSLQQVLWIMFPHLPNCTLVWESASTYARIVMDMK